MLSHMSSDFKWVAMYLTHSLHRPCCFAAKADSENRTAQSDVTFVFLAGGGTQNHAHMSAILNDVPESICKHVIRCIASKIHCKTTAPNGVVNL